MLSLTLTSKQNCSDYSQELPEVFLLLPFTPESSRNSLTFWGWKVKDGGYLGVTFIVQFKEGFVECTNIRKREKPKLLSDI